MNTVDTLNVVLKKGNSDKFLCTSGCGIYVDFRTLVGNSMLNLIKKGAKEYNIDICNKVLRYIDSETVISSQIEEELNKEGYTFGYVLEDILYHELCKGNNEYIEDWSDFQCVMDTDGSFWLLFVPEMYPSCCSQMPSIEGTLAFFDNAFEENHLTKKEGSIDDTFGYYNIVSFVE